MGTAGDVNPYGLIALGLLGGWFSKTTTDKLQEVFETLFKTDQDAERSDKLTKDRPVIEAIDPSPVPAGQNTFKVIGAHFQDGTTVLIDGAQVAARCQSPGILEATLTPAQRPAAGTRVSVQVRAPEGSEPLSEPKALEFQCSSSARTDAARPFE